jgi:hypothetical protein
VNDDDVPLLTIDEVCEDGLYKSTLTVLLLLGVVVDVLFNGIFIGEFWGVSSLRLKKFSFADDDEYSLL